MQTISYSQWLTLILFLLVLGGVWAYVRMNRDGLSRKIAGGRRIEVVETTAISPTERGTILRVNGQEWLVLRGKNTPMTVTPLGTSQQSEDGA